MTYLTDKWKNDELDCGVYYVQSYDGVVFPSVYSAEYDSVNDTEIKDFWYEIVDIEKVLAPVPSYEEWQSMDRLEKIMLQERARLNKQVIELLEENIKLKELLKEAYPVIDFGDGAMMSKWEENWLTKAKEILGEDK